MTFTMPAVPMVQSIKRSVVRTNDISALEARVARLEQYLATQHHITRIIAAASELETALPRILEVICETADWDFGEVWYTSRQDNHLYCEATWRRPGRQFPHFETSGQNITFGRGKGLPGRVWASGQSAWLPNVVVDRNFARTVTAKEDGLQTGIAIPIRAEGGVIGALTFFSRKLRPVDRELMQVLDTAGSQIGLFIERKRAEAEERKQARLLAALEERQRLARDLHDSVTQTLFSVCVVAEMLPVVWSRDPNQVETGLADLHQLTRDALTEMRSLLSELRSPAAECSDLTQSISQLADTFTMRTKIKVSLDIRLPVAPPASIQTALYRITQEALNNVAKHAAATQVWIRLECDAYRLNLSIQDNGRGFDAETIPTGHLGVAIMRERAEAVGAALMIDSVPGKGTCLSIHTMLTTNAA